MVDENIVSKMHHIMKVQNFFGDKIEKNEMGGECSKSGGEERCIKGFLVRTPEERDHLGDPGVDGRIILR
jgi:hypothetical protein